MASRTLVVSFIVVASLMVYFQVRDHDFVYFDDQVYIIDNPHLLDGVTAAGIAHDFSTVYHLNWHPLTSISYRVDYALYGLEAPGFLLTNVVLHSLAAAVLYLALFRMTRAPFRSAFVAAVFALHPLHVESVAWASGRKDVLSGVFFALMLFAYARYAERPSRRRMLVVGSCLALGLLSKSVLVTAPFVLLLLDYWPLGRLRSEDGSALPDSRRLGRAFFEKWPLFVAVAVVSIVTWGVQDESGATAFWELLPLGTRVANAIHSYGMYLVDSIWPTGLAMFYPHLEGDLSSIQVALAAVSLAIITIVAAASAAARPYLIVGWLWFLGMLVPMIGLIQVGEQARADRYMYLPLIGLSIAIAWGAHGVVRGRNGLRLLAAIGIVAVAALSARSWDQVGKWRDSRTLFEHAISVTDGNYSAHIGLGDMLRFDRLYAEAAVQYAIAADISPRWARAHLSHARAMAAMGDLDGAVASFERALGLLSTRGRSRSIIWSKRKSRVRRSTPFSRISHFRAVANSKQRATTVRH